MPYYEAAKNKMTLVVPLMRIPLETSWFWAKSSTLSNSVINGVALSSLILRHALCPIEFCTHLVLKLSTHDRWIAHIRCYIRVSIQLRSCRWMSFRSWNMRPTMILQRILHFETSPMPKFIVQQCLLMLYALLHASSLSRLTAKQASKQPMGHSYLHNDEGCDPPIPLRSEMILYPRSWTKNFESVDYPSSISCDLPEMHQEP